MLISHKMAKATAEASLVRLMFEEGLKLKARYGPENVFDFTLGNPDLPPPPAFQEALLRLARDNPPNAHAYMPNAGWPQVREQVAAWLNQEQKQGLLNEFTTNHVIMTVGAAGALNIILKAISNPGDEIITPRPYFMEYNFYADNHGAVIVPAEPGPDFGLNPETIRAKITPATRAVLINSPHNPTGAVYREEELAALGRLLTEASALYGRPILLIADEPYRKLVYDGLKPPSIFPAYPYSIAVYSHSKDLSLPGERIGYAVINPDLPKSRPLFEALTLANRILGFVNAPSSMQLILGELQGCSVEVARYQRRRDLLVRGLRALGYKLTIPSGAFYIFPQSPIADDLTFVNILKEEKILTVPGRGFAQPNYFRICYCASEEMIEKSLVGFARALARTRI